MNYAIPRDVYSMQPYRNQQAAFTNEQTGLFEQDPAAGYDYWLRSFNPNFANDLALRRLFNTFQSRYNADVAAGGTAASGMRWTDWLKGLDANQELARTSSNFRGMQPQRFDRPARYVAF